MSDFGAAPNLTREVSTKVLPDVIESLIDARFSEGGITRSIQVLSILLPDISWLLDTEAVNTLKVSCKMSTSQHSEEATQQPNHAQLGKLVEHKFSIPNILLEALTHASYLNVSRDIATSSYERLELYGDTVLTRIVTDTAFMHYPWLDALTIHLMRIAVINNGLLGYLCLAHTVSDPAHSAPFRIWQAMRSSASGIAEAQQACLARFDRLETELRSHFHPDTLTSRSHPESQQAKYPWALLETLRPPKFLADIIESLLGAIYIDSGSYEPCRQFLDTLGWFAYFKRVLAGEVGGLIHPKGEVEILAGKETVKYEITVIKEDQEIDKRELSCRVSVGGELIAEVTGGRNKAQVQCVAAEKAVEVLKKKLEMKAVEERAASHRYESEADIYNEGDEDVSVVLRGHEIGHAELVMSSPNPEGSMTRKRHRSPSDDLTDERPGGKRLASSIDNTEEVAEIMDRSESATGQAEAVGNWIETDDRDRCVNETMMKMGG